MKLFFLSLFLLLSCQSYNSHTGDAVKYKTVEVEASLLPAYTVLQNRCVNCHTGRHNSWASYITNEQWIASGLIVPGDAQASTLIRRIINSNNIGSNMPPTGGPLPNDEYQVLVDWVNGL